MARTFILHAVWKQRPGQERVNSSSRWWLDQLVAYWGDYSREMAKVLIISLHHVSLFVWQIQKSNFDSISYLISFRRPPDMIRLTESLWSMRAAYFWTRVFRLICRGEKRWNVGDETCYSHNWCNWEIYTCLPFSLKAALRHLKRMLHNW